VLLGCPTTVVGRVCGYTCCTNMAATYKPCHKSQQQKTYFSMKTRLIIIWNVNQYFVGDLQDIVATRRRRFIGHVLLLPASKPASLVIDWTPEGECRRWGRPKRTWRDTFMKDMRAMGVSGSGSGTHDEIRSVASDRARWRQLVGQCPSKDRRT